MNLVIISGYLGADPELRFTQSGQAVLNMRVATTEKYLDKNKVQQERTDWHSVVIWGKRAEGLAKHLSKGSGVEVTGSLRTSSYDDKEGVKRYKTEINCTSFEFGKSKGRGGGNADSDDRGGGSRGGGNRGSGGGAGGGGGSGRGGGGGGSSNEFPADNDDQFNDGDDIPF